MTVRPCRRGMAPLEFVMVFPLLLALTAALFLIARADISKSFSATDARNRTWAGRQAVPPGEPLVITASAEDSLAARTTLKPVPPGPLFPGGFRAESRNTVFAHPWDYRAVPFQPGRPKFEPHLAELGMVAGQVPMLASILNFGLTVSGWALDPERNVFLQVAGGISKALNGPTWVAGWILEHITAPALGAATAAIRILMIPLRLVSWFSRSARRALRYLESVVDMINVGTWACHNLYDAAEGRRGNWNGNIFVKLLNFRP